jgi:hypothetical protein
VKHLLLIVLTFLLLLPAVPAAAQGGDSASIQATVIFGTAILREGPGLDFPATAQLNQGEALTITGRTNDSAWYQVLLPDGGAAWVADYVVSLEGASGGLPVIDVTRPIASEQYVPPGCDYFGIGPFRGYSSQSIILTQGWEAASRELIDEYLNNVVQIVSFDGRLISTYSSYRSEVFYNEPTGTWRVFWSFNMGPVAAGEHITEWTQMFSQQITDGLDSNGDGQPDRYGPDLLVSRCTLIIE